jgi:quercetin dioxygenase-like cupin family protein
MSEHDKHCHCGASADEAAHQALADAITERIRGLERTETMNTHHAGAVVSQKEQIDLATLIEYSPDAIVSRTLAESPSRTVTLFAFDAGQGLSEHSAPFDAFVQVLDGEAELTIGGEVVRATPDALELMPANVPHAVRAPERFKMLLVMIRESV